MDWISVHERLPRHKQKVLVWHWDKWYEAVFNKIAGQFEKGDYYVADVRYWAEVKMPGEE